MKQASAWADAESEGQEDKAAGRVLTEREVVRCPRFKTLADFRVAHGEALGELFAQVLGVLSADGLVTLECVMHDGTKIQACAGGDSFRREGTLQAHLKAAREQVAAMGDPRLLRAFFDLSVRNATIRPAGQAAAQ